ncbi:hypothetical protein LguiA_028969 [Lonicera macranthoides]
MEGLRRFLSIPVSSLFSSFSSISYSFSKRNQKGEERKEEKMNEAKKKWV